MANLVLQKQREIRIEILPLFIRLQLYRNICGTHAIHRKINLLRWFLFACMKNWVFLSTVKFAPNSKYTCQCQRSHLIGFQLKNGSIRSLSRHMLRHKPSYSTIKLYNFINKFVYKNYFLPNYIKSTSRTLRCETS
jgi:hypothetical protein